MLQFLLAIVLCAPAYLSGGQGADRIVAELRDLPAPIPATGRSDGKPIPSEVRRRDLYDRLRKLGKEALPALAAGLRSPDVRLRRNVTLALGALAGPWYDRSKLPMDIRPLLPDLIAALEDRDNTVRGWSAQAIGHIGASASSAVPALLGLLGHPDEGSRNSACIALRGIGPPAKDALPALRKALSDPSKDVRRFAQLAIAAIEAGRQL